MCDGACVEGVEMCANVFPFKETWVMLSSLERQRKQMRSLKVRIVWAVCLKS